MNAEATGSLQNVLQTLGYHTSVLATDPAPSRGRMGIGASRDGPYFRVAFRIEPTERGLEPVWDQVYFKIEEHPTEEPSAQFYSVGNRPGAEQEYARLAVPVVNWAAENLDLYDE